MKEQNVNKIEIPVDSNGGIVSPLQRKKRRFSLKYQDRYALTGFICILPFLIGFALFKLAPLVVSLQLSFSHWAGSNGAVTKAMQWVGWGNYTNLLFNDVEGRLAATCSEYFTSTLLQLPIINISAFLFAILLNKKIPGQSAYRAIFFVPVLIGSGYAYEVLKNYISEGLSISIPRQLVFYMVGEQGLTYVSSFFETFVMTLWKTGVQTLLYLTGLQGISKSLYESAYCDGATEWEQFWKITLPLMTPTIFLCMIYTIIIRFNDTDNPFSDYFILKFGATDSNGTLAAGGELAAVAWTYAAISIVFILLVFLIMNPIIKKCSGRD